MRLPNTAHTSRPWRIHELTRDFRLEDVWALPTPGGPDDFHQLVQHFAAGDASQSLPRFARVLWALRWKVGELLGWDGPETGVGSRVPTLRDRLPADLRDAPSGPEFDSLPFTSLYQLEDEWAAETANRTVHGVMHIELGPGRDRRLPRPDGRLGEAERDLRNRLHGSDQAVPAPDRLPRADATDRAAVARASRRSGTGARLAGSSGVPPEDRWVILYDADCGFCKWLLAGLLRWDRAMRLRPIALQRPEADELLADLAPAERLASWHLISPSGERQSGGAAVAPLLALLPWGRVPAAAVARFPRLTDRGYRWVAEHRSQLSKWVPTRFKQQALSGAQRGRPPRRPRGSGWRRRRGRG